jgi:hypothetical protein
VTDLFEQSDDRLRAAITDVAQDIACGTLTKKYLFGAMETLHGCSSAQGVWTQRDAYDLLEAALTQHLRDAEKPTLATIASLSRLVETLNANVTDSDTVMPLVRGEPPEKPGTFELVDALENSRMGGLAALIPAAQRAQFKQVKCDGAVWIANAVRRIRGS